MMTIRERRQRVLSVLIKRNRYQFGQPRRKTTLVKGGAVACTDTAIQLIVWIVKGKKVSLDEVRRRSGAPAGKPMKGSQARRALRRFGLHDYDIMLGKSVDQVMSMAKNRGPVIIAEMYWAHPQWRGYRYAGRNLDGKAVDNRGKPIRVGYARDPRGRHRAGLTQWTFRGGHAVLLGTVLADGTPVVRDSNHNSGARPERPAWDEVTKAQLARMLKSWPYGYTYVIAPKRKVM